MSDFLKESNYIHNKPKFIMNTEIREFLESSDDTLYIRDNSKVTNSIMGMVKDTDRNIVLVEDAADANVSSRLSIIIDDLMSLCKEENKKACELIKLRLEKECNTASDLQSAMINLTTIFTDLVKDRQLKEFILTEAIPFKIDDYENTEDGKVQNLPKSKSRSYIWTNFIQGGIDGDKDKAATNLKAFLKDLAMDHHDILDTLYGYFFNEKYPLPTKVSSGVVAVLPKTHIDNIDIDTINNIKLKEIVDSINCHDAESFLSEEDATYDIDPNIIMKYLTEYNVDACQRLVFKESVDGSQTRLVVEKNGKQYVMASIPREKTCGVVLIEATGRSEFDIVIENLDKVDANQYAFIED